MVLATEVEEEINKFEERERRAAKLQKKPYKEMTPAEKDRLRASLLQEISARETQFARYEQAKKEAQAKAKEKKKDGGDEEDENEKEEPEVPYILLILLLSTCFSPFHHRRSLSLLARTCSS